MENFEFYGGWEANPNDFDFVIKWTQEIKETGFLISRFSYEGPDFFVEEKWVAQKLATPALEKKWETSYYLSKDSSHDWDNTKEEHIKRVAASRSPILKGICDFIKVPLNPLNSLNTEESVEAE